MASVRPDLLLICFQGQLLVSSEKTLKQGHDQPLAPKTKRGRFWWRSRGNLYLGCGSNPHLLAEPQYSRYGKCQRTAPSASRGLLFCGSIVLNRVPFHLLSCGCWHCRLPHVPVYKLQSFQMPLCCWTLWEFSSSYRNLHHNLICLHVNRFSNSTQDKKKEKAFTCHLSLS